MNISGWDLLERKTKVKRAFFYAVASTPLAWSFYAKTTGNWGDFLGLWVVAYFALLLAAAGISIIFLWLEPHLFESKARTDIHTVLHVAIVAVSLAALWKMLFGQ